MRYLALATVVLIGCGGAPGEPLVGSVTINWGATPITPTFGIADVAPSVNGTPIGAYGVLLGTAAVNCGHDLGGLLPRGDYVSFYPKTVQTGMHSILVSVTHPHDNGFSQRGATGMVEIREITGDRVRGRVDFQTTDMAVGTITANGEFDVRRCFP